MIARFTEPVYAHAAAECLPQHTVQAAVDPIHELYYMLHEFVWFEWHEVCLLYQALLHAQI